MEFVPGENGEDVAYFTKTNTYKNLCDPIDEMNVLDAKIMNMNKEKVAVVLIVS